MNLHKAKGLEGRVVFLADPLAALLRPGGRPDRPRRRRAPAATSGRGTRGSWARAECSPSRPTGPSTTPTELELSPGRAPPAPLRRGDPRPRSPGGQPLGRRRRGSRPWEAVQARPRRRAGPADSRDVELPAASRCPHRARRPRDRATADARGPARRAPRAVLARRVRHRHGPPRRARRRAPPGRPDARARHRHGLGPPGPRPARARRPRPPPRPRPPRARRPLADGGRRRAPPRRPRRPRHGRARHGLRPLAARPRGRGAATPRSRSPSGSTGDDGPPRSSTASSTSPSATPPAGSSSTTRPTRPTSPPSPPSTPTRSASTRPTGPPSPVSPSRTLASMLSAQTSCHGTCRVSRPGLAAGTIRCRA